MASPLRFLRAGPPPPTVALLPDALFFTRAIPIAAGATPAEAATQVELALEGLSPFPLAQLYYGWFWAPGAPEAFVFAAYRRRFTTEQTADWPAAELVLPAFASVFGLEVEPATTAVIALPEGLTAVHWATPPVPSKVIFRPLSPEATDEERAKAREELLRAFDGSRKVIDLPAPPEPDPSADDGEIVFRAGELESRLSASVATAMDVRDKAELAAYRAARKRDVLLWRVAVGCAALIAVLIVGEFARLGGRMWNDVRVAKIRGQKPTVEKIMASQSLAMRIDDLATKRLLPFEMITQLFEGNRKPPEITFRNVYASTRTGGIHVLTIEAQSSNAGLVSTYLATLRSLPNIASVEDRGLQLRGDSATFTLVVTFKPDTVKQADSIASQ